MQRPLKVFAALELGGNFGHLGRQLPIADALRRDGSQVLFAVNDIRSARAVLAPARFEFVQAPINTVRIPLPRPPANYSELLLAEGYGDVAAIEARVRAWVSMLRVYQPDVVLVDHAPTALLAARSASIPTVQIANGFEIPPNLRPLPCIRTWEHHDQEVLAQADARVTATANECLRRLGSTYQLDHIVTLFSDAASLLATFPELDHYEQRPNGSYCGPLYTDIGPPAPAWPSDDRPHVLAYLHNGTPGLPEVVAALRNVATEAHVLCLLSRVSAATAQRYSAGRLRILPAPFNIASVLPGAHLVITHANLAVTSRALIAGAALALMPSTVEQQMISARAEQLGAGVLVGHARTATLLTATILSALSTPSYRAASSAFAQRYRLFDPRSGVEQAVRALRNAVGKVLH